MPKQFRLPKEFATKWVEALRSGNFKQCQNMLSRKVTDTVAEYCCMGVAGSVCGIGDVEMRGKGYFDIHETDTRKFILNGVIPRELDRQEGEYGLAFTLGQLNDKKRWSFEKIADWIEQNVEFY